MRSFEICILYVSVRGREDEIGGNVPRASGKTVLKGRPVGKRPIGFIHSCIHSAICLMTGMYQLRPAVKKSVSVSSQGV
jgi:hypothetical protein